MLFRNAQSQKNVKARSANIKKIAKRVSKQAGRRRSKKSRMSKNRDDNDIGYIFCSDESPHKCWKGKELSEILQQESKERLKVKINLWTWRHIIIGIVKAHIEEIAPFLSKDEKASREVLEMDVYRIIFPWLAGHQAKINVSIYGLDAAFPRRIQPALLRVYRRISRIWHFWLGFLSESEQEELMGRIWIDKRRLSGNDERGRESESARKRRKVMDSETQATPKKTTPKKATLGESHSLDIEMEDSPLTKRWVEKAREAETMLKKAKMFVTLRRQSRSMLKELGMG